MSLLLFNEDIEACLNSERLSYEAYKISSSQEMGKIYPANNKAQQVKTNLHFINQKLNLMDIIGGGDRFPKETRATAKILMNKLINAKNQMEKEDIMDEVNGFLGVANLNLY